VRVAFDTNILVYAQGLDDDRRRDAAIALISELNRKTSVILPVQVLGELSRVLFRKGRMSRQQVGRELAKLTVNAEMFPTDVRAFEEAVLLSQAHDIDIWDSVIVAVAAEAKCDLLLSEDMNDGFTWRGVIVANPFAERKQPLLASILSSN
jgi:predicted nucleic acid-binding protein